MRAWEIAGIVVGCWFILAGIVGCALGAIIHNAEQTAERDWARLEATQEFPAIQDDLA